MGGRVMNKYHHWLYNPQGLCSAIQCEVGQPYSVAMETEGLRPTASHGNHQKELAFLSTQSKRLWIS